MWRYKWGTVWTGQKLRLQTACKKVYSRWKKGEITAVKAMEELDMKRNTFYKLDK